MSSAIIKPLKSAMLLALILTITISVLMIASIAVELFIEEEGAKIIVMPMLVTVTILSIGLSVVLTRGALIRFN